MDIEDFKALLEEQGLKQAQIDEIMGSAGALVEKIGEMPEDTVKAQILKLQEAINGEKDWKKKAALVAQKISLEL